MDAAEVAELVDAHDSKSCPFGGVGSIPTFGTLNPLYATDIQRIISLWGQNGDKSCRNWAFFTPLITYALTNF